MESWQLVHVWLLDWGYWAFEEMRNPVTQQAVVVEETSPEVFL